MMQWLSRSSRYGISSLAILAVAACAGAQGTAISGRAEVPAQGAAVANSSGLPAGPVTQEQVLRGRLLVLNHGCGDCHGGFDNLAAEGRLSGWRPNSPPGSQDFQVGPFHTYARNITPDNATGIGRFSERQIFNALRYGLRPGETPDVEITSTTPGEGNFPANPKYLAIPMPWPSFRHMPDEQLWAIAAYLKHGVEPVSNRVPDSEGPPDFWASTYAEMIGTYPAPPFPAASEKRLQ